MPEKDMLFELSQSFSSCSEILSALGDETRQHLILTMMKMGECDGVRVGAITKQTNLSRPAVSHHLAILKKSGIVKVRREGTKNYYYFDKEARSLTCLIEMLEKAREIMQSFQSEAERKEV